MDSSPKFLSPFQSLTDLTEENDAFFECHISPENDESLEADWFHDDKPLTLGFRYDPYLEDGKVGLYIASVYETDSGTYKCKLKSKNGTAEQSATLSCKDTNSPIMSNPMSESGLEQINLLEHPVVPKPKDDNLSLDKDSLVILRPLKPKMVKHENMCAMLDLEVAITNEKNLKNSELIIEWFHNQAPLLSSNRFKRNYEFGVISLKIDPLNYHDRGLYQVNIYGQSPNGKILLGSQQCQLDVRTDSNTETQPICYDSYQKIKKLEAWERPSTRYAALNPGRQLPSALAILMKRRAATKKLNQGFI